MMQDRIRRTAARPPAAEAAIPMIAQCPHAAEPGLCEQCKVRSVSVCAALGPDELAELERLAEAAIFAKDEAVVAAGEPASSVYNLTAGSVRLLRLLPDGRRQIVGFLLPGDFVGLSLAERHAFSAEAIEPVRACRFARTAFSSLVDAKPHLLRRLHEAATHELSIAQDHMVLLGRRSAEEKVAAFLVGLRDRLVRLGGSAVTIPLAMTRQDIADYLGLTIETVSRTISRMGRDRVLLVVPDGIRIIDAPRLETLAAS
ncbi:MAG: cyclic nucleotide-binding domain-containing protein [Alphaproteobacteria bacterium]